MIETRAGDVATREAFQLAELFQKMVLAHKTRASLLDQFAKTCGKLQNQMKGFQAGFNDFLSIFQKIADCASATSGSSTDIGSCLSRIVMRHREVGEKMEVLTRELQDGMVSIQSKTANCRTCVANLDKDHGRNLKKMRSVAKKRSGSLVKLEKKVVKEKLFKEDSQKKECVLAELLVHCKEFEEQERMAVKKMAEQERNFFAAFLKGIKPVLLVEMAMFKDTANIDETIQDVDEIVKHENTVFDTSDGIISVVRDKQGKECANSHCESLFGSRLGSLQSLNSFCGSRLSCSGLTPPSCSFQNDCFEPKLVDRTSSLSYDSQDSGIAPCQLISQEDSSQDYCMTDSFIPIDRIKDVRYSTVRRSPSPFRSSRNSFIDCPKSRGRVTSKPPLPRRLPVPARSPSIEKPSIESRQHDKLENGTENEYIPDNLIYGEDMLDNLIQAEDILDNHIQAENTLDNLIQAEEILDNHIQGQDILDNPNEDKDHPTEEDQEVLYYMTADKSDSGSWDVPSRSLSSLEDEETFDDFLYSEDLPPPPDFLLHQYC
eukprot:GFUD01035968.1.p1 GENE.GFUD01035968.1~~GFUD01035968.1.p1  ORF type:complete len:545 (+),score=152.58 GFUD01035968.1:65-1699(+)